MLRIALIYDDRTRPETTGSYCRRALQGFSQVQFFHPQNVERIPTSGFDLYLRIDDGLRYRLPDRLHPVAYWAIDTHVDFGWSLEVSKCCDFVFAAQRPGAQRLRESGIESARWLPLAADPEIHRQHGIPKKYDVSFVGNLFPGPRTDLVRLLQQHFRHSFVGRAYFDEMARIYSASHVVFNRSLADDVNMRVFEALSCGSLLMTNALPDAGQAELFRDGVHLATYSGGDDLLDKMRFYLERHELRARIARAGRDEVLAQHTYKHRMGELVRWVEQELAARAHVSVPAAAPSAAAPAAPGAAASPAATDTPAITATAAGTATATAAALAIDKNGPQDPSYFDFPRPDLLALVPTSARRVLDVGCGAGRLGEAIKARQQSHVVGIELDESAAARARDRLDQVVVADIEALEQLEQEFGDPFDCIVLGDVLEHLRDPSGLLVRLRGCLQPGGCLLASVPNVRHHTVVRSLLDGNWTYEPAGLLDHTHLHFFTRQSVERLFARAGYSISSLGAAPAPGEPSPPDLRAGSVRLGQLSLEGLAPQDAQEFFVYQWLVTAVPGPTIASAPASCAGQAASGIGEPAFTGEAAVNAVSAGSIVIENGPAGPPEEVQPVPPARSGLNGDELPACLLLFITFNRLEYTKLALEAVLALEYPGRLNVVVWDNASTDGTVDYLEQRLRALGHIRLIASAENRGVVYPMNAAWFAESPDGRRPDLLAKIDNDTLVPPELLKRLAECHIRSARLGVLSGFHFRREGEALADEGRIQTLDGVRLLLQPYVGGCAVMVRRQVLDRLGKIPCAAEAHPRPFMDSGWTIYQQRIGELGLVNGYPYPLIHVDHMEDTRSAHCIRSAEHQQYKRQQRGMDLEEFTNELCVWRPAWPESADGSSSDASNGPSGRKPSQQSPLATAPCAVRRMRFNQNFRHDFHEFDFRGPPFAFARFADGERAICTQQPVDGQDGWSYPGGPSPLAQDLLAALSFSDPDYYLGISDGCCDAEARDWYLQRIKVPLEQVTFSNIFVNGNYRRFQALDLSGMAIVASEGGDYSVPYNLLDAAFDLDELVDRLTRLDRPILVSAGPLSCVIIHKYWMRAARRRVIIDVGSAIDERTKRKKTRMYQHPGTRTAELSCVW
ncbi:MAG: glycosyltransferase [Pirellulales bacterium]